jgi:hypothetical protein
MTRYTAVPRTDGSETEPSHLQYGLKIAKWVYIFDLVRAAVMVALLGLNIDATVISKAHVESQQSLLTTLMVAMVEKVGMNKMQKVELGFTIFYVSDRT